MTDFWDRVAKSCARATRTLGQWAAPRSRGDVQDGVRCWRAFWFPGRGGILVARALAIMVFAAVGSLSQAKEPIQASINERYSPAVNVAGEVILGLMAPGALGAISGSMLELTVHAVVPEDKQVCVRISSLDGRYQADLSAPVDRQSGVVRLRFRSKHLSALQAIGGGRLAMIARGAGTAGGCQSAVGEALIAAWGAAPQGASPLTVLVNSLGAERVSVAIDAEEEGVNTRVSANCSLIKEVTVAFDRKCILELPPNSCGPMSIVLSRRQGDIRFPPQRLRFRAPCPALPIRGGL